MTAAGMNLTIDGPGVSLLTINGNNNGDVFEMDPGVTAAISGLTITGGSLSGRRRRIGDLGSLTLSNCTLTANLISAVYVDGHGQHQ